MATWGLSGLPVLRETVPTMMPENAAAPASVCRSAKHNMLTSPPADTQYLVVPRFARECDEKGIRSETLEAGAAPATVGRDAVVPFTPLGQLPGRQSELLSSGEPGDLPGAQ